MTVPGPKAWVWVLDAARSPRPTRLCSRALALGRPPPFQCRGQRRLSRLALLRSVRCRSTRPTLSGVEGTLLGGWMLDPSQRSPLFAGGDPAVTPPQCLRALAPQTAMGRLPQSYGPTARVSTSARALLGRPLGPLPRTITAFYGSCEPLKRPKPLRTR